MFWYGHVLRSDDCHVLKTAFEFDADHQRKNGRLKSTWKKEVEEESMKVGLCWEGALYQKWIDGVNLIVIRLR